MCKSSPFAIKIGVGYYSYEAHDFIKYLNFFYGDNKQSIGSL